MFIALAHCIVCTTWLGMLQLMWPHHFCIEVLDYAWMFFVWVTTGVFKWSSETPWRANVFDRTRTKAIEASFWGPYLSCTTSMDTGHIRVPSSTVWADGSTHQIKVLRSAITTGPINIIDRPLNITRGWETVLMRAITLENGLNYILKENGLEFQGDFAYPRFGRLVQPTQWCLAFVLLNHV